MKETGGPAFPTEHGNAGQRCGMTLRDYFAAKAMQVFLENMLAVARTGVNAETLADSIPKTSYAMADDMLKARDQ